MRARPSFAIDALTLTLPHGFGHRASAIVRHVGRQLAELPLTQSVKSSALHLPPIEISGSESDRAIARQIALGIHKQLSGPTRRNSRR